MRLSSMADYAVVTMSAAARHCGSTSLVDADGRKRARVSSAQLADETGLPVPTVQKLVSMLSAAGLLRSVRGAHGGLQLARPAAAISIADIVEAVEGPIALTACVDHGKQDCALECSCSARPHWSAVNAAMRGALADVPLSRFVAQPPKEAVL
ncbi:Rrf2 family transcriptional regulator [Altererythrobacter sp. CC-YST694]|uniref:RrF2 family transcriptional regulator n=1 Tax=Altererythrobacter sp. CC-YST694 TaxID=2755038 RepID=UPI001D014F7E|nr:Rrf2 family transcriptional regulator [Altererythrobacter sp. CC-YST694]MCB5425415.1 Rrf2 family transcriptional regulator [Altererythrobacter sp. CC-YST694]